ncbi:MAG: hypothetical protein WCI05_08635 [Myxococcales bacterium]
MLHEGRTDHASQSASVLQEGPAHIPLVHTVPVGQLLLLPQNDVGVTQAKAAGPLHIPSTQALSGPHAALFWHMHAVVLCVPVAQATDLVEQLKFLGQSLSAAQLYGAEYQLLMSVQPETGPPHTS